MEAVTKLQHVGGNWQFHKGEQVYLYTAHKAESLS
jgi:hypothetical protein